MTSISSPVKYQTQKPSFNLNDQCMRFFKRHPRVAFVTSLGLTLLGTVVLTNENKLTSNRLSSRTIGLLSYTTAAAIFSLTLYGWKHLCGHIWHEVLNRPFEPTLNKKIFKMSEIKDIHNNLYAKLEIKQVTKNQIIPILNIEDHVTNPFDIGYAQGYLLGSQIWELVHQVLPLMVEESSKERQDPNQAKLQANEKNLFRTPQDTHELKGIAKGFQQWADENHVDADLEESYRFLVRTHVLTDTYKAVGSGQAIRTMGCSTVAYKDPESKKIIIGRLLDWVSLDKLGELLYVKSYSVHFNNDSMRVFSHTFPGFIGGLTCWNTKGLVVIVNELGITTRGDGTPYSLFTKHIIEQCTTVKEAEDKIKEWQTKSQTRSASSFALTIADKQDAAIYYFYPGGNPNISDNIELKSISWEKAVLKDSNQMSHSNQLSEEVPDREIQLESIAYGVYKSSFTEKNEPLIVTNHCYTHTHGFIENSVCDASSNNRLQKMLKATDQMKSIIPEKKVEYILKAAGELASIGTYIFNMDNNTIRMANDNYSAVDLLSQTKPFNRYFTVRK